MRPFFTVCVCSFILFATGLHAATKQQIPIASTGETIVAAKSAKLSIQIKIKTHEVQIGKSSDKRPDIIRNGCTYSRYPCSIVDYIDITVNNKPLLVPRSVYCDLADLNTAEVKIEQKDAILILIGGDTSESYIVKITFDIEQVKNRITSSGMIPDQPLQETTYHRRVLGD